MISRLFEITYMLLERGAVTARELSERFEVSVRTIYRDVENLSAAGIPVYMTKGRNGGIRLLPDFVLDKTVLTQREKEEILSALSGLNATGHGEPAGALSKLGALFGDSGGSWIEVEFSGWGWGREARENFGRIKQAVLNRRVIAFTYFGSGGGKTAAGESTRRTVEPLKLVFRGQSWYLYGWCRSREDYRFFKLSRMEDVTVLDETFDRRAPARVTDLEVTLAPPETVAVVFQADEAVSFRIYDEYPHGCITRNADGSLLVDTTMPRGEWLVSYYLTYGPHVEILEPGWLRSEMRANYARALDKYDREI
jgi:predicted DNA-binding transcriptional regulator YafY